jgi:pimeloyl-ACP methyl ester carboxylesterase
MAITLEPIVLVGGFGSHWADYKPVAKMLSHVSGRRVFIANINRLSWLVGGFVDYNLMLDKLHKAVGHAQTATGSQKVTLVGHSAGGVISRAYLGDKAYRQHHPVYEGHQRVSRLITLGSPLRAARTAKRPGVQQAAWVDEAYPGRYFDGVQYLTVCGRLIEGRADGSLRQREAFQSYQWVSAEGEQWGDGTIPLAQSTLDGVPSLTLEGVGHSPNWGRWYFSTLDIIRSWWHYFDLGDAPSDARRELLA